MAAVTVVRAAAHVARAAAAAAADGLAPLVVGVGHEADAGDLGGGALGHQGQLGDAVGHGGLLGDGHLACGGLGVGVRVRVVRVRG